MVTNASRAFGILYSRMSGEKYSTDFPDLSERDPELIVRSSTGPARK